MIGKVALFSALAAPALGQAQPAFSNEWSAYIAQVLQQAQGNYQLPNYDLCCEGGSVQCQVQVQASQGMTYFSVANNATTQVFGAGQQPYAIVDSYTLNMEMAVDQDFNCVSYCPLNDGTISTYSVDGYNDAGVQSVATRSGQTLSGEAWMDVEVLPIVNVTMSTETFLVDQSNLNDAIPLIDFQFLTPFGEQLGQSNTTWTQWKSGPQDPKNFQVNGAANCPMDSQCGSSIRQLHRLSLGRKQAFYRAHYEGKLQAARAEIKAVEASLAIKREL